MATAHPHFKHPRITSINNRPLLNAEDAIFPLFSGFEMGSVPVSRKRLTVHKFTIDNYPPAFYQWCYVHISMAIESKGAMKNLIGHLDADCFYASAERVRFPHLKQIPIGILGNQGACVIAKSYEMKARGVTTAMPVWEAVSHCPEGVYVKRDFQWYEVLSRKMLELLRRYSPTVEYYSIDEFFFEADCLEQSFGCPLPKAVAALQKEFLEQVGVPVSIGVSTSRILAKLGSDSAKPYGWHVLTEPELIAKLLREQPVGELTGIGFRSALKLEALGIKTCADLAAADRKTIRDLLTVKGEAVGYELQGESVIPIQANRPPHKCVARGGSLGGRVTDPEVLNGWLIRNLERLTEALFAYGYQCGCLGLELQLKDRTGWSRQLLLHGHTDAFEVLALAARKLLQQINPAGTPVSYMHLLARDLRTVGQRQLALFEQPSGCANRLKHQVNQAIGRFALRSGATLTLPELYSDQAHDHEICDIYGKTCF